VTISVAHLNIILLCAILELEGSVYAALAAKKCSLLSKPGSCGSLA
jgi:hypothetical protein